MAIRYTGWSWFSIALASLLGCGNGQPGPAEGPRDGWQRIVSQDWALDPGAEDFWWQDFYVDRDRRVSAIRAVEPLGTHHVVFYGPGAHVDLFVALPGTGEFRFPTGVGFWLRAADKLAIQVHALNATPAVLSATSGIEVREDDAPDAGDQEANILNAAVAWFSLPAGETTTVKGRCTLKDDQTLFAIGPHMHRLGVHQRATLEHGDKSTVLFDGDFQFDEQGYYPLESVAAHAGDVVTVACTYRNTTSEKVGWGNLSTDEMCLAQIYRYPAGLSDHCTN